MASHDQRRCIAACSDNVPTVGTAKSRVRQQPTTRRPRPWFCSHILLEVILLIGSSTHHAAQSTLATAFVVPLTTTSNDRLVNGNNKNHDFYHRQPLLLTVVSSNSRGGSGGQSQQDSTGPGSSPLPLSSSSSPSSQSLVSSIVARARWSIPPLQASTLTDIPRAVERNGARRGKQNNSPLTRKTTTTTTITTKSPRISTISATPSKAILSRPREQLPTYDLLQHRETYNLAAWYRGFQTVATEDCYELDDDEQTTFPSDLCGTFFQNGMSKFTIGSEMIGHLFDGDGMVTALTFDGQGRKAWFRNRFVETEGYLREKKANKILYRGVFGTVKNHGAWYSNALDFNFKNVANTNVLFVPSHKRTHAGTTTIEAARGERLFALWEGGRPYELDPINLKTLNPAKESTLDGTVSGRERYAAHYKVDPKTGHILNFSIHDAVNPITNMHTIMVMEHQVQERQPSKSSSSSVETTTTASQLKCLYKESYSLPGIGLAHDMVISEHYFCLFQASAKLDPLPLALGQKGPAECLIFDAAVPARAFFLPRGAKKEASAARNVSSRPSSQNSDGVISIDLPPCFSFHCANAFEEIQADESVHMIVDAIMGEDLYLGEERDSSQKDTRPSWEKADFNKVAPCQLVRFRFDLESGTLLSQTKMTSNACGSADFPVINPLYVSQPYRYAYCCTSASAVRFTPNQGLVKVDVQSGRVIQKWLPESEGQFLSEVAFARRERPPASPHARHGHDNDDDEDYGYLVGYLMDGEAESTSVLVFDARNIAQGPIAQSKLSTFLGHNLHGTFVPNYTPRFTSPIHACFQTAFL